MAAYHYSYLNLDHSPEVIQHWKNRGCYNEIEKKLGYRFRLISVKASDTVVLKALGAS